MNERGQAPRQSPEFDDEALRALRDRLEALQRSVDLLGTEPPPQAAPVPPSPAAGPAGEPEGPGPRSDRPPVADNGGGPPVATGPAAPVRLCSLDAGPFAGLVELSRFEEALAALPAVRAVRVRRFAHRRARIEVAVEAARSIGRELVDLGLPMRFEPRPGDVLAVHLPEPDPDTAEAGRAGPGPREGAVGRSPR